MVCYKCSAPLRGDERVCPHCGTPLTAPLPEQGAPVGGMPYGEHPYKQLGGILQYVVILYSYVLLGVAILSAIGFTVSKVYSVVMLRGLLRYGGNYFPIVKLILVWLVIVGALVAAVIVGFKLANKIKKRSADFLFMWQLVYFIFLAVMLAFPWLAYKWPKNLVTSLSYAFVLTVTFVVWNLYFTQSVRVRTYMGSDAYLRKSIFNKNTRSPMPAVPDAVPAPGAAVLRTPKPVTVRPEGAPGTQGRAVCRGTVKCLSGMYKDFDFPIENNEELVIGNDAEIANIVIDFDDQLISSKHCSIRFEAPAGLYLVTDYSTYGTYLDSGSRLQAGVPKPLAAGTIVYLGDRQNSFQLG